MSTDKQTQEALIETIDIIVKNRLKNLGFNYYVDGVICSVNTDNTYNVMINDVEYKNIRSKHNFKYSMNDAVQILIKNGQWSKKFIDDKINHNITPLVDIIYPVGSMYTNTENKNPKEWLGGTWTFVSGGVADDTRYFVWHRIK